MQQLINLTESQMQPQKLQYDQIKSDKHFQHLSDGLQGKARLNFIRKVYSILTMQLVITLVMCLISYNVNAFLQFQINNQWLMWVSLVAIIVVQILIFCTKLGKKTPSNILLLLVFTVMQSYMVSFICSITGQQSGGQIVVIAAVMTLSIFVALTLYAIFTKTDFTTSGGILTVLCTTLLVLTFVCIFTRSPILNNVLCALGVILFGFFIIFDTQQIVGGKRYQLSLDDYIIGSLILYIDIIQMFLYILRLLSDRR